MVHRFGLLWLTEIVRRIFSVHILPPIQSVPGAVSPGVKLQGRQADHSPLSSAEFQNGGTISSLPARLQGVVLN
jgi:hypothetical protein